MATIVKTTKGYKAVIRKSGWPTTSKSFRTKRDAQDWARRIEDEMVRGVYIHRAPSERLTLSDAVGRYLKEVSVRKKASTHYREERRVESLKAALGNYSLAAITPDVVAKYRDQRLNTPTRRGSLMTADAVRLELALLSHLFTVAIREWGLGLVYNPVQTIRKPSPSKGRDRRISRDEEKRLLEQAKLYRNPMAGWIIGLALETAMRKSEILGIERKDVNVRERVVHLGETKTDTPRDVPLTLRAVEILKEALAHPVRPLGCEYVFFGDPGKDNTRNPYVIDNAWRRIVARANIMGLHFHDLRHEAVSRLVEAGLSDQEVAAISGHKTMQMLKRYTHLRGKNLVRRLDCLLPSVNK